MTQPLLRLGFVVSRELHKPLFEVMGWGLTELVTQAAYNLTLSDDWKALYEKEKIEEMPMSERVALHKKMTGSKK